jgi:hypothetical protein
VSSESLPTGARVNIGELTESLDLDDRLALHATGRIGDLLTVCEYCRAETGEPGPANATHRTCSFHCIIIDLEIVLCRARFLIKRLHALGLMALANVWQSELEGWKLEYGTLGDPADSSRGSRAYTLLATMNDRIGAGEMALPPSSTGGRVSAGEMRREGGRCE